MSLRKLTCYCFVDSPFSFSGHKKVVKRSQLKMGKNDELFIGSLSNVVLEKEGFSSEKLFFCPFICLHLDVVVFGS